MPVTFGPISDDDDRRNDPFWKNRSYIHFYVKSVVKHQMAVKDYPVVTMLAEFAGYSGIIFGISLIDLTHLLQNFKYLFKSFTE